MSECLRSTRVFRSGVVAIDDVRCRPHGPERSREEWSTANEIALTRSGVFVQHVGRRQTVINANHALFFSAGEPYQVSHPTGLGDDCTAFRFSPGVLLDACRSIEPAAADRPNHPFRYSIGPASPDAFLLAERLRRGLVIGAVDTLAADEVAIDLLERILRDAYQARAVRPKAARPETQIAHRNWVDAARIETSRRFADRLTLDGIARSVHCSPFHLARLFRRHTGLPLHRYVNRLRLRAALARLPDERNLTAIALDLGFSSHSHFTTAFRIEFGASPAAVRASLTTARQREMSRILKA